MSLERLRFACRDEDCEERFLTWQARNGHESVHAEEEEGAADGRPLTTAEGHHG